MLEDAAGLLADLVESALNDALARLGGLELGHKLSDLGDVPVDGLAVVASQRDREVRLAHQLDRAPAPRSPPAGGGIRRLGHPRMLRRRALEHPAAVALTQVRVPLAQVPITAVIEH